jgi:HSP20 family molecular chaperone IbpA
VLPDEIDGDNVGAHVEHGLLTLSLNVHPKAQPKKIAITSN